MILPPPPGWAIAWPCGGMVEYAGSSVEGSVRPSAYRDIGPKVDACRDLVVGQSSVSAVLDYSCEALCLRRDQLRGFLKYMFSKVWYRCANLSAQA